MEQFTSQCWRDGAAECIESWIAWLFLSKFGKKTLVVVVVVVVVIVVVVVVVYSNMTSRLILGVSNN